MKTKKEILNMLENLTLQGLDSKDRFNKKIVDNWINKNKESFMQNMSDLCTYYRKYVETVKISRIVSMFLGLITGVIISRLLVMDSIQNGLIESIFLVTATSIMFSIFTHILIFRKKIDKKVVKICEKFTSDWIRLENVDPLIHNDDCLYRLAEYQIEAERLLDKEQVKKFRKRFAKVHKALVAFDLCEPSWGHYYKKE